jgi:uncharacterized protein (TIGR04255 family)
VAKSRYLARAPITEALIDIRVQAGDNVTTETFEPLRSQLSDAYPTAVVIKSGLAEFRFDNGMLQPVSAQTDQGLMFKSPDERTLAQFRLNGFTLNRLAPYTQWESIFPEALRLWALYASIARPIAAVRLAARYINRLQFPLPVSDLTTYLTAPPRVPEGVPQFLRGFLTRLIIHDPNHDHSAIVTQALEPSPADLEHLVVLLDIDAYREVELQPDDDRIQMVLNALRQFKNDIFFSSITDSAAELFG